MRNTQMRFIMKLYFISKNHRRKKDLKIICVIRVIRVIRG